MKKVTLRSIWEHKRRLVSTVLAIVLGVAFMSGTFVFADTIDKVFDDLFSDVNEEVDVQVQGVTLFDGGFGGGDARQELDIAVADTVAAVDGVERVAPFVQTLGFGATNRVIGPDGEVLGSSQGPPTLLESWIDDEVLNPYSIAEGTPPTADDELTLNVGAADDAGIELGDTVTVLTQFGESEYTVVGTFLFGEAESAAGAVSVDFTLAEAQRIAGLDGKAQVVLAAGDGMVVRRSRNGSFGKYVEIKHDATYATAYAHLSRYAEGLEPGARIRQGDVIGYIGATGLATGPNLHYEVLQNGKQVDPVRLELPPRRILKGKELARFEQVKAELRAVLARASSGERKRWTAMTQPAAAASTGSY